MHGQDGLVKEILVIVLTFYDKTGFMFICVGYNWQQVIFFKRDEVLRKIISHTLKSSKLTLAIILP